MQVTLRFCDDLIAKKRGNNTRADYLIETRRAQQLNSLYCKGHDV